MGKQYDASEADVSELFRIKYNPLADNTYNSKNVAFGRVKKRYDLVGKRQEVHVPLGFAGGYSAGTLGRASSAEFDNAQISAKKIYQRVEIDRFSWMSSKDEGAAEMLLDTATSKAVENALNNIERFMFGSGDGSLGTIAASSGVSGSNPYVLTISDATWKESNFEENAIVNIETGNTDKFEITAVDSANKQITVNRLTGSQTPVNSDEIFAQNAEDAEPEGFESVLSASSGTLYGIPYQRRWSSTNVNAAGAGLTTDFMNEAMIKTEEKCGIPPNLIITSYTQYRKALNLIEDHKRYSVPSRKGQFSFEGLQFMSSRGPVGIFPARHCGEDKMYFLNDNHLTLWHTPGFGWFTEDKTTFLRLTDEDAYEARYGGYLQFFIEPPYHARGYGLAV